MPRSTYQLDFATRDVALLKSRKARVTKSYFLPLFKRGISILQKEKPLREKMVGGEIQLILSDDKEVRIVNRDYRGKDAPTDVVSLSYFEAETKLTKKDELIDVFADHRAVMGTENLLGEIIISVETAARQAREHQKTLKQELQFLFVHGLLHVFGYDHEKVAERKIMFDLQDEILQTKSWRKIIG